MTGKTPWHACTIAEAARLMSIGFTLIAVCALIGLGVILWVKWS